MTTVYMFTFSAEWLEGGRVIQGTQAYPVTCPDGALDIETTLTACKILAAQSGTLLFPERRIEIRTFAWDMARVPPLWDDCGVRIY